MEILCFFIFLIFGLSLIYLFSAVFYICDKFDIKESDYLFYNIRYKKFIFNKKKSK